MQDAINWLFNDPRSQWYNLMDPQTGEMEVGSFDTVLSRTQAFQRHILRNLANRRQMRVPASSSLSGNFVFGDDDAEHPNRAKVIRICDRYVLALHNYSHGPAISLDWPLVRRNQAVRACRQWVLRGGLKPRRKSACPRSRGYFSNEGRLQSVKLRKPGPGNLNPAPLAGNTLVRPPGG
jgi:hypothetical protein